MIHTNLIARSISEFEIPELTRLLPSSIEDVDAVLALVFGINITIIDYIVNSAFLWTEGEEETDISDISSVTRLI